MGCERHEEDLIALAFDALEAPRKRELRSHLDVCASCRVRFDEQQRLAETIDRGVAASVSASPSPEFLGRVREHIAAEPAPRAPWWQIARPAWVPIAAGALATLALVVWFTQKAPDSHHGPVSVDILTAGKTTPPEVRPGLSGPSDAAHVQRPSDLGTSKSAQAVSVRTGVRPLHRTDPPVIVPPGQREAVLQLYAAIWSGKTDGTPLTAPFAELDVPELKIAPLVVPLLGVSEEPSKTDGDLPAQSEPGIPHRSL
jgi:predicted anti-sigma-YlaC factor YlaD